MCDKIVVSTDSKKIANVAKKYGAEVPLLRNKKFAQDLTTTEKTSPKFSFKYGKLLSNQV